MLVREIMTRDVVAIDADSSILDAGVKMKLYEVGMLVVSDSGKLTGIVTDRDIVVRGVSEGADPTFLTVKNLMTTNTVTCHEDDSLEQAAERMREAQIRRLIVLDAQGEPVGVLSVSDIAGRCGDAALAGRTLQGITRPSEIETVRPHREA